MKLLINNSFYFLCGFSFVELLFNFQTIIQFIQMIFNREARAVLEEPVEDDTELKEELDKIRSMVEVAKAKLSKKARAVGLMKRKLDQIPDRAELAQYQRRFVELSNEGMLLKSTVIGRLLRIDNFSYVFGDGV